MTDRMDSMDFDFTPYFEKYEELVAAAEEAFNRVKMTTPIVFNARWDVRTAAMPFSI